MFFFTPVFKAALATAVIGNIVLNFIHVNLFSLELEFLHYLANL